MTVSLLEACDDRMLIGFAAHPRQRELLGAIDGHRLVVCAAGRRFGKSRAAAAAALHNLLLVPELDGMVAPGEPRYAVSVANSAAQAAIFLEHARSLVRASPTLRGELADDLADRLVFSGNRVLAAFPANARSGRGWAISFLVLDELAHAFETEDGGHQTQERLWAAMTPSVAQFGELGRIVVISTPLGDSNLFAQLYAKARGGEIEGAEAFHAPTSDNPMIERGFLEAQLAALGVDDFAREFSAEFVGGGASFIEESRLREVVAGWREALPTDAVGWLVAFDPSFSRDPAAAVVVGRDPQDRSRLVVGHAQRWLPPRQTRRRRRSREEESRYIEATIAELAGLVHRFGAGRVVTDQHLPGVVVDELRRHGVAAVVRAWTAEGRTQAAQGLRARIYTGRIVLPDDPQLVAELARLRSRVRAGSAAVELPKVGDSHCDLASALMAAVAELDRGGIPSGEQPWRPRHDPEPMLSAGMLAPADETRSRKWYDRDSSMFGRRF